MKMEALRVRQDAPERRVLLNQLVEKVHGLQAQNYSVRAWNRTANALVPPGTGCLCRPMSFLTMPLSNDPLSPPMMDP